MRTWSLAVVLFGVLFVGGCGGGGRILDKTTGIQNQMTMDHYKIEAAIRDVRNQQAQSQQRLESLIWSACQDKQQPQPRSVLQSVEVESEAPNAVFP